MRPARSSSSARPSRGRCPAASRAGRRRRRSTVAAAPSSRRRPRASATSPSRSALRRRPRRAAASSLIVNVRSSASGRSAATAARCSRAIATIRSAPSIWSAVRTLARVGGDVDPPLGGRADRLRRRRRPLPPGRAGRGRPGHGAAPSRRSSARRRRPSADGERQTFPVQTTRMEAMSGRRASLTRALRRAVAGARAAAVTSPRAEQPRRPVREVEHRGGPPLERLLLAEVHGDARPPKAATSSSHVVAGGSPERFALVTASGPAARARASASGWSGHADADRGRVAPQVATPSPPSVRGSTIVSGPGQHAAARRVGALVEDRQSRAPRSADATSTGSVRSAGRSFAANTAAVAAGSSGRVPTPYTVSVGNTISAPRRAAATAASSGEAVTAAARRPRGPAR